MCCVMQDLWEKKRELEEKEREKQHEEKLEFIKKKDNGSAIASTEVKQILQVILFLMYISILCVVVTL